MRYFETTIVIIRFNGLSCSKLLKTVSRFSKCRRASTIFLCSSLGRLSPRTGPNLIICRWEVPSLTQSILLLLGCRSSNWLDVSLAPADFFRLLDSSS